MENKEIEQIKDFLKKRKITYDVLAEKSGIPIGTIKSIFSGRTPTPRIDTMRAIKTALGISTDGGWTIEERARGARSAIQVSFSPDEDDLIDLYRRIGERLGKPGQTAFKQMGETLLKMEK